MWLVAVAVLLMCVCVCVCVCMCVCFPHPRYHRKQARDFAGDAGGVAQALPHSRGGGGGNGMHGSSSIIGSHAPVRYRQPAPDPRAGMSAVLAERPF